MSRNDCSPLWRLGESWAMELERVAPKPDFQEGCERLLAAQRWVATPKTKPALRPLVAAAAAALVCATVTLGVLYYPFRQGFRVAEQPGVEGAHISAALGKPVPIRFAGGSELMLDQNSQARVETSSRRSVRVVLERGLLQVSVKHKKASSWRVEAGPFTIIAAGTRFEVRWDPAEQTFAVQVTEGSVKVTGPLIRREQVASVGTRCTVDLKTQSLMLGPIQ